MAIFQSKAPTIEGGSDENRPDFTLPHKKTILWKLSGPFTQNRKETQNVQEIRWWNEHRFMKF